MRKKSIKLILLLLVFIVSIEILTIISIDNLYPPKKLNSSNSENPTFETSSDSCGIEICNADRSQVAPEMCEDGNGGAIIAWRDHRIQGSDPDIYVQKVDSDGNVKWLWNGIMIHNSSYMNIELEICSDGLGGAIVAWTNLIYIGGPSKLEIFAQRIDSDGNSLWNNNGLHIANTSEDFPHLKLCGDGSGGAILVWMDLDHIYTQRVSSNGDKLWSDNGETLPEGNWPEICSDDMTGAIIVWNDARSGDNWDIYTQRFNSTGDKQWHENGTAISNANLDQIYPLICNDGLGGAIIIWSDERGGSYAQRIDSSGDTLWENNGSIICDNNIEDVKSDGEHGIIYTYADYYAIEDISYLYGQRINSNGNKLWGINGTKVFTSEYPDWFEYPQICCDDGGGAFITWNYRKNWFVFDPPYNNTDIYVQKVTSNGDIVWQENGMPVCVPASDFRSWDLDVQICNDGKGGAIISYEFVRYPNIVDIYAQRINSVGELQWNIPQDIWIFIIIGAIAGGIGIAVVITIIVIKKRKRA